jgi:hypothetical protein
MVAPGVQKKRLKRIKGEFDARTIPDVTLPLCKMSRFVTGRGGGQDFLDGKVGDGGGPNRRHRLQQIFERRLFWQRHSLIL